MSLRGMTPTRFEIRGCAGDPIRCFSDWEAFAMPPERKQKHWKEFRSAFELGRCWTAGGEPRVPAEIDRLLDSNDDTKGVVLRSGVTEHETALPFGNRGPRCHDLALIGGRNGSTVAISVEAKADEPFGGTITDELRRARKRTAETRFPGRLKWLTHSLFGIPAFSDADEMCVSPVFAERPYQLFTAVAGALLEAELLGAASCILAVHEFRTPLTTEENMQRNGRELDSFMRLLLERNSGADTEFPLECGRLAGPLLLLERTLDGVRPLPHRIPLFVGKVRTDRA
jgi:hypothetical protein